MGKLFDGKLVFTQIPLLLKYLPVTMELAVTAMIASLILGLLLALVKIKKVPVLKQLVSIYISVIRGTPILVQLYVTYFGIPMLLKYINFKCGTNYNVNGVAPIVYAFVALALNESAFNAEIIRASLESVRKLLGLEDVISLGTADPKRPDVPRSDWAFTLDEGDVDPVLGIHYISEAYLAADPDYTGRFTVPALVDIPSGKVVNNDYFNLTLYFETAWKPYHKEGAPDLYPEDLREEIDKLNDIIFREVNNGVYKAGFARKQKAYDRAYNMVFNRLDWLEERLANQRYLFGDRLTESDVRLYVTLVRFDCAYYPVFRLNKKLLRDYPNLWAYARDLYQTPGFGDTTNFAAIKKHYHIDCCPSNEFAIVPNGPDESLWLTPHGREKLSGK